MSRVKAPQATQRVLLCHGQDVYQLPGCQGMPGHAAGFTRWMACGLTTRKMARILAMDGTDPDHDRLGRTRRVAWDFLTCDMAGHSPVFAVINPPPAR